MGGANLKVRGLLRYYRLRPTLHASTVQKIGVNMARNRVPTEKALTAGLHLKNPKRFKNRTSTSAEPVGEPYPNMTEAQKEVWYELASECPWIKRPHRMILRLTAMAVEKFDNGTGVMATNVASSLLSKLGATPLDRSKVQH